ncbi:DNA polymerase IV, partial [Streptomyces sp. SID7499]|nr:DNA polymerase IV [Streptomyces sp. SID7499]
EPDSAELLAARRWPAGHDVHHEEHGHGWVQGSGVGRVTVRFEEPWSAPGRVLTFRVDDPLLRPADPLPLVRDPADYSSWPASLPKSRSGADPSGGGESSP